MTCTISDQAVGETIAFHGHSCPGLAIGMRVAEYVRRECAGVAPQDLLCVTETDMCGVDAIQFLTGCTFGKGNLIHRDFGKTAFTFYNRAGARAFRLVLREDARGEEHAELAALMSRSRQGQLSGEESERLGRLRNRLQARLMTLPLEEMFVRQELEFNPPRPARVLQSLTCASCGEATMESRTRRYDGQTLCIPCFSLIEQKV